MNSSNHWDTYSFTFTNINRGVHVFPESLNKMVGVRKFCDLTFVHADEKGDMVAHTEGVIRAKGSTLCLIWFGDPRNGGLCARRAPQQSNDPYITRKNCRNVTLLSEPRPELLRIGQKEQICSSLRLSESLVPRLLENGRQHKLLQNFQK